MRDCTVIGGEPVEIWPASQVVTSGGHETIMVTRFTDTHLYHPGLKNCILDRAKDLNLSLSLATGFCGVKVYDVGSWDLPEASLINERAMAMFLHVRGCAETVVHISWASVYNHGDYCMPHSHLRTSASIVYFLDSGDPVESDSLSGRFCFVDPRVERCCEEEAQRMTTPYVPAATPGTMIMFPSQLVHFVTPYFGNAPRITMSWDIDQDYLPGPKLPPASTRR